MIEYVSIASGNGTVPNLVHILAGGKSATACGKSIANIVGRTDSERAVYEYGLRICKKCSASHSLQGAK